MMTHTGSAAFAIAFVALYQLGMKIVPHNLNPISVLMTFYVTAIVCTLVAAKFLPGDTPIWSISQFSWAAVMVGVAVVGIELGFLLMYRAGWSLAAAPLVTMGGAVVVLAPIAIFVFKQPATMRFFAGIVLCVTGLYLLMPKS